MRFVKYVNQYMLRLGFVNCVCAVAGRELDTRASLHRRFDDLVFRRVYTDEPEFGELWSQTDPTTHEALEKLPTRRKDAESPLVPDRSRTGRNWFYAGEIWVAMSNVPSHVGYPDKTHSEEYIELARALGLILRNYSLSEVGSIIHSRMNDHTFEVSPVAVCTDAITQLCLLHAVLSHDILAPFVLTTLSSQDPPPVDDLLLSASETLASAVEEHASIDDILTLKEVRAFGDRLSTRSVRRNQLRPRMEHYVDLGLLARKHPMDEVPFETAYLCAQPHSAYHLAFKDLLEKPLQQESWLDKSFFKAAGLLYNRVLREPEPADALRYFIRAFPAVKRGIGFTPGRTVALFAGIRAWLDGLRLEVAHTFDEVYRAAHGPYAKFLQFSGGSRLDREFLISVLPEAEQELDAAKAE